MGHVDAGPAAADRAVVRVVLLGKPGCHLCDAARLVVTSVCGDLGVPWEERDILVDPVLADRYWEEIPVVLVDGVQHAFWRVDADRLRAVLTPQGLS